MKYRHYIKKTERSQKILKIVISLKYDFKKGQKRMMIIDNRLKFNQLSLNW